MKNIIPLIGFLLFFQTIKGQDLFEKDSAYLKRIKVFDDFTIKGAGGESWLELAKASGANTIRTWSVKDDGSTKALLDKADSLGLKVVLGFWMANQGSNKGKDGYNWNWDYEKSQSKYLDRMNKLLDSFGNHPAILMWGLGNEVNGSFPDHRYMKCVNELSKLIHSRNPNRLTCVVTNTNRDTCITNFKKYSPDLDLLGVNGYGPEMVNKLKKYDRLWQKAFYVAEYNVRGPWGKNVPKTTWGTYISPSPQQKIDDIKRIHEQMRKTSGKYKGGVVFLWDVHIHLDHLWHSVILPTNPDKERPRAGMKPLMTVMSDELIKFWTGKSPQNSAPVITDITVNDTVQKEFKATLGTPFTVQVKASDAEGDNLNFSWWIYAYDNSVAPQRKHMIVQEVKTGNKNEVELTIDATSGYSNFQIHCLVKDGKGSASAHTFPIKIY